MITGKTSVVAHLGYPTAAFKAPMIYNPWFERHGIDAAVVPMGVKAEHFPAMLAALRHMTNLRGALVTMPHKITVMDLIEETTPTARIAGACNALLLRADGTWLGDQFDGTGFVRGLARKGFVTGGRRALVSGCGGVGSAIAASLAQAGIAELMLFDTRAGTADALADRLRPFYPQLRLATGRNDPDGFDLIVNATPMGMNDGDPLPFDVARIAPTTFVGEVVMKAEMTPLLRAAQARGCPIQVGTDMLFEMIPAYLEFFSFGVASADELRSLARIRY